VRRGRLGEPCAAHRVFHRPLECLVGQMMTTLDAVAEIDRPRARRKDTLPAPFARRARILAIERERKPDGSEAVGQVAPVQLARVLDLLAQRSDDTQRQHRHAVLVALAVAHEDLAPRELDVLHPQAHPLHDAQPGAIQQRADQPMDAQQPREHLPHLGARQHHGQTNRHLRLLDLVEPRQLGTQHLFVEKEQRALGLILRGCGHPAFDRQRGQERFDVGRPQLGRVAPAMEDDEALDPVAIGLLGADAVMPDPDPLADPLE